MKFSKTKKTVSLKAQLRSARSRNGRDAQAIGKLKKALVSSESERVKLAGNVSELKDRNDNQRATIDAVVNDAQNLRFNFDASERSHERRSAEIRDLKTILADQERTVEALQKELAEADATQTSLRDQLDGAIERVTHLREVSIVIGRAYDYSLDAFRREDFERIRNMGAPELVTETAMGLMAEALVQNLYS